MGVRQTRCRRVERSGLLVALLSCILSAGCEAWERPAGVGGVIAAADLADPGIEVRLRSRVDEVGCTPTVYLNGRSPGPHVHDDPSSKILAIDAFRSGEAGTTTMVAGCGVVSVVTGDASPAELNTVDSLLVAFGWNGLEKVVAGGSGAEGPRLANKAEVLEGLVYPEAFKAGGIEAVVSVWVFIDEDGRVYQTLVATPSGMREFGDAVEAAAWSMVFAPAMSGGAPRPARVAMNIRFDLDAGASASEMWSSPTPGGGASFWRGA